MKIDIRRILSFMDDEGSYDEKDKTFTYGKEVILEHAIWKSVVSCMDKNNRKNIRKLVHKEVDKELDKWSVC